MRLTLRADVTWRYLPHGRVKHALLRLAPGLVGHQDVARCGVAPVWYAPRSDWRGDGDEAERERVKQLPECLRCTQRLKPQDTAPAPPGGAGRSPGRR